MRYYEVWVRSDKYRGKEALTYRYEDALDIGQIVQLPLRSDQVLGVVMKQSVKPAFATKAIISVLNMPPLPPTSIQLASWLQRFYASPIGVVTGLFIPSKIHTAYLNDISEASNQAGHGQDPMFVLSTEQQAALSRIDKAETYVLHGRTGSGKTRVYIELARRSLKNSESVLILCPEIGLSSQLALQFQTVFGHRVVVLHSQLTAKEREIAWLTVLTTKQPLIVIGPRSALFSPLHDIGTIIVDEAHDQAYKQEQPPYYQATRVASQLRQISNSVLILGSATPSVTDYYLAQAKAKPILRMSELARKGHAAKRRVVVVDLKDRRGFSRSQHLSTTLLSSISTSLEHREQALLYLNRRGTARVTLCNTCGWQALCPNCDLPLAYHGDAFTLRCHICGYHTRPPFSCPVCGNQAIALKSFGTKAIAEEARRIFPEARIMRFDTDTAKSERLEQQYEQIMSGNVDILVGTQMLAKGLDLPHLSTLGVIMADSSLYLPDYTATERTYQLLTQVVGRVGRGHLDSRVIVQTYYPESPLLQAALNDDWENFYNGEIAERKQYQFPPFSFLLKLSCRRATQAGVEKVAKKFAQQLRVAGLRIEVEEPTPAFHEKNSGQYQWQVVVKSKDRGELLKALELLPNGWSYDLDPADLL